MTNSDPVTPAHLDRRAVIYIRQSSPQQVISHQDVSIGQEVVQNIGQEEGAARLPCEANLQRELINRLRLA